MTPRVEREAGRAMGSDPEAENWETVAGRLRREVARLREEWRKCADALERLVDAQTGINMGDLGGALVAARAALRKAGRHDT